MSAETTTGPNPDFKKKRAKRHKTKRYRLVTFDKERFYIVFGVGCVSAAIGLWIIWTTKAFTEVSSQPVGITTAQKMARILPETTREMFVFIIGNLFVLFGVVCIFICLRLVVQYIAGKLGN